MASRQPPVHYGTPWPTSGSATAKRLVVPSQAALEAPIHSAVAVVGGPPQFSSEACFSIRHLVAYSPSVRRRTATATGSGAFCRKAATPVWRVSRVAGAAILLVAAAIPGAAGATPSARLVYSRSAGAASCADEQALRAAVAKRVGYDPFFPVAKQTIVASISRVAGRRFVARIVLVDERGVEFGAREFHVEEACADLLDTMALAIAIAIDPQSLAREPRPQNPPAPEPPPTVDALPVVERSSLGAAATPSPAPTPAATPAMRLRSPGAPVMLEAAAGVVGSVGVAPAPGIGGALGAALRWRDVSLGLEGRFDAPASVRIQGGGSASTSLVLLALAPCGYAGPLLGCGLIQRGQMRASGEAPGAVEKSVPWWAAGGRFGLQVPVGGDRTVLRLSSDLLVNLVPQIVQLAGTQAWKAPRMTESLGLDVVVHFL